MNGFIGENVGKIFIVNLYAGELLLEGIRDKLEEFAVRDALALSAVGTLQKVSCRRVAGAVGPVQEQMFEVAGPLELSGISGIMVAKEPHFHIVFSDAEKTYSGHLEYGCAVLHTVEITLAELKGVRLQRIPDLNGIKYLRRR